MSTRDRHVPTPPSRREYDGRRRPGRRLTRYDGDGVLGRSWRFLPGTDTDRERVIEMRDAIDKHKPVTVELRNYRKDGTEFWNRVSIVPVKNDEGDVTNFVGFQHDITKWKNED